MNEINKELELGGEYWIRTCPVCGRELKKKTLSIKVACLCGWVWEEEKKIKDESIYV